MTKMTRANLKAFIWKREACTLQGASMQAVVSGATPQLDSPSAHASKSRAKRNTNPNKTDRTWQIWPEREWRMASGKL